MGLLSLVVSASSAFCSPSLAPPTGMVAHATPRAPAALMADDELSMLAAMSDSFWKQKRARMQADLEAKLLELEEYEAREKALQDIAIRGGGDAPAVSGGAEVAQLKAALEAEQAKTAALEQELRKTLLQAEVNLQKVASFW